MAGHRRGVPSPGGGLEDRLQPTRPFRPARQRKVRSRSRARRPRGWRRRRRPLPSRRYAARPACRCRALQVGVAMIPCPPRPKPMTCNAARPRVSDHPVEVAVDRVQPRRGASVPSSRGLMCSGRSGSGRSRLSIRLSHRQEVRRPSGRVDQPPAHRIQQPMRAARLQARRALVLGRCRWSHRWTVGTSRPGSNRRGACSNRRGAWYGRALARTVRGGRLRTGR